MFHCAQRYISLETVAKIGMIAKVGREKAYLGKIIWKGSKYKMPHEKVSRYRYTRYFRIFFIADKRYCIWIHFYKKYTRYTRYMILFIQLLFLQIKEQFAYMTSILYLKYVFQILPKSEKK